MTLKYDKLGVSFQYPDNWTLNEEDALAGRQSVTVYSPDGAFWTLALQPRAIDPAGATEAALEAMRQEYGAVEAEAVRENVAGRELAGYDLFFYYLDLINTAKIRTLQDQRMTYTIFCQAEDRDFDRLRMVFQAITVSLLQGLNG